MNGSQSTFDRTIASSVEAAAAPPFPDAAIRSAIANRTATPRDFSGRRRFAAAIALMICSGGLAYGAPKVLHAMSIMVGAATFKVVNPNSSAVDEREMFAERSFHVRLPAGWPPGTQRGMIWRMGPPAEHAYIVQYFGAGRDSRANAVVFLEKADQPKGVRTGLLFKKKDGGSIGTSWTSGDERITLLAHEFSSKDLQHIRAATP